MFLPCSRCCEGERKLLEQNRCCATAWSCNPTFGVSPQHQLVAVRLVLVVGVECRLQARHSQKQASACHIAATCSAHLRASQCISAHLSTSQHLESRNLLFDRGSATGVTGCEWLQGNMRCSCWCLAAVFTLLQRRTNTTRAKTMLRNGTFFQSYTSKVSAASAGACLSGCGRGCGGPPANKNFLKNRRLLAK